MLEKLSLGKRTFQRILKERGVKLEGNLFTQEIFDLVEKEVNYYFKSKIKINPPRE